PPRLASITIENDFFAGYDRHYTNGIQVAFLVDRDDMPAWMQSAPPVKWSADPQVVVAFGQRIYTPANTLAAVPDPADRPYAGWAYFMTDVRTASNHTIDHLMISLGVVGPGSLARQTQDLAHNILGEQDSNGWSHQLHNEPALLLGYERAWPGVIYGKFGHENYDMAVRVGGDIGNVMTYASTGAVFRYGHNLPTDIPVTHISLGPPRDGYRGTPEFGWYGWIGFDARLVAHNIFIQGNTFRDSPGVRLEPLGADLQLGAALAWPRARFGFTFVARSREYRGQPSPDRFGQLTLSLAY
ncbi:MAG TPA: lipid A deacylase LpxR family protein, partial [Usitatibacter sp.]